MNTESIKYVKDILPLIEQFLQGKKEVSENWVEEFAIWLGTKQIDNSSNDHMGMEFTDVLIGMQLINTSNMLKTRLNKFVVESPFATFMDYQFLYILKEHLEMTKSELISANSMEMSSGIEVIKRLLKNNWVSEKPNPNDGRSKLIMVTNSGEKILKEFNESAQIIYTSFSKDFDYSQKKLTLEVLTRILDNKD